MLVLTRRIGESVVIGEGVYMTVIGLRGNQIRLAFDAPKHISIHRDEIQRRIWREQGNEQITEEVGVSKESVVDRLIRLFKRNPGSSAPISLSA